MADAEIINIPVAALSETALLGVIDEYIVREGTDYGHQDIDIEQKRAAVRRALREGHAIITYDAATRTTSVVARESLQGS